MSCFVSVLLSIKDHKRRDGLLAFCIQLLLHLASKYLRCCVEQRVFTMSALRVVLNCFLVSIFFTASLACSDKASCLALSKSELYRAATAGRRVGKCYISRNTGSGYCDLYVKSATVGEDGDKGWPKNSAWRGTGCVKAPDFPKRRSTCFYSSGYGFSKETWSPFCTQYGVDNAVAQLRHAIQNDQCGFTSSSTSSSSGKSFNLNKLVPEAKISGWNCGHSPGKGSCFVSTATYLAKVAAACASCLKKEEEGKTVSQPTGSKPIQTGTKVAKKCARCARAISKAPKCGGKLFGIGSKRKGTSCKLIDGTGCWPLSSARVLHDCGKGAECRFKISNAKAKVWCCRRKTRCKWYQAGCHWRNTFRCSNSALSKSKDKNGAQVLWQ